MRSKTKSKTKIKSLHISDYAQIVICTILFGTFYLIFVSYNLKFGFLNSISLMFIKKQNNISFQMDV